MNVQREAGQVNHARGPEIKIEFNAENLIRLGNYVKLSKKYSLITVTIAMTNIKNKQANERYLLPQLANKDFLVLILPRLPREELI